jgi:hypothetical protein
MGDPLPPAPIPPRSENAPTDLERDEADEDRVQTDTDETEQPGDGYVPV